MGINKAKKRIIAIISLIVLIFSAVFICSFNNKNALGDSKKTIDESAGSYIFCDDFTKTGFSKDDYKSKCFEKDNVYTGEYGNFKTGLIPVTNVGDIFNAGDGYLIYQLPLSYKGIFVNLYSLNLDLVYKALDNVYSPKLSVEYSLNNKDYINIKKISPQTFGNDKITASVDFNGILSKDNQSALIDNEYFYVKINLIHDSVTDINLENVSLNLFSVSFCGYYNFINREGAMIKSFDDNKLVDIRFCTFISKELYEDLNKNYNISFSSIVMPVDYDLEMGGFTIDNLVFGTEVQIGKLKGKLKPVNCVETAFSTDGAYGERITIFNKVNKEYYLIYGGLYGIKRENMQREFVSKVCILISDTNGTNRVLSLYANNDVYSTARSASYLAQKAGEAYPEIKDLVDNLFVKRVESYLTTYTLKKVYVDDNYNIIDVIETKPDYSITLPIKVYVEQKVSDKPGYSLREENNPIMYEGKVLYRTVLSDICYASGRTTLTLYYTKNI